MQPPAIPENEQLRLRALVESGLLDSAPEERFDRLTAMAKALFSVPIVLVSLVDRDRQWFKSRQGLDATETPRDISFCGHAILQHQLFVVENALEDPRFSDNPLVVGAPHIRFYAGAPIRDEGGYNLGTLCLIGTEPQQLSKKQQSMLRDLAVLVEKEIQYQDVRRLNRQLRESRDQYASLVENIPGITYRCLHDKSWTMLFMSREIDPLTGYPVSDFIQNAKRSYASLIPEEYHQYLSDMVDKAIAQKDAWHIEYPIRHADGKLRWIEERGNAIYDEDDNVSCLQGFLLDISREKAARDKLQRQNQALNLLNKISFELSGELQQVIERALKLGCEFLNMDMAIVSEVLAQTYVVRWFHSHEPGQLHHEQRFALAETYCDITLSQGKQVAIAHMRESAFSSHRCYQTFGMESYIAQPLKVDGKLFGTLNFTSASPRLGGFDEIDRLFVSLLERWLGAKLDWHQQRRKLKNLVEQVPGMIYQYRQWPDGRISLPYASPGIEEIYGLTAQELEHDASALYSRIHNEDVERVSQGIAQSQQQLSLWHQQYRITNAAGEVEWIEGRAVPVRLEDGSTDWYGYIASIQAAKQIELTLESSEQRLRALFELSPIGIALIDFSTARLLDCNAALLHPSGYRRGELLELHMMDLVPPDYQYLRHQILEQLQSQGRFDPVEAELQCKGGRTYPIRLQGVKITDQEQNPLLWCLVEDISEHKRIERMQKEFIATVSHELRTPLTSIKGALSLLGGGMVENLPEKAKSLLSAAYRNSNHLGELIDDILDLEKLTAGAMIFDTQTLQVSEVMREAKELYQHYGQKRGIRVRLLQPEGGHHVRADKKRLLQALGNLLSNAIKFSPEQDEVTVSVINEQQQVRILVQDQGPGIAEAFKDRIFSRFAQADSSDTRKKGGTGLGLAITRELMEQMGGSVDFVSVPGQGTTFWLQLPQAEQQLES
ncbi:PAS domain-containing protein [Lacimicrobium alkaliphilum]|uniref:histidine kinase n=1 Tax=Lacimicrobium alkaliphilum TaxID=1526571 RepID=A0A0U2PDF1_9ALTE|nr:PAS domain-containing protein [Lacimicrobium alkaliphilum]ALS97069.1 hypothetical protein AT746_01420 [Lacimicrobium alkaliphilum]